jgi:hypothetical protein
MVYLLGVMSKKSLQCHDQLFLPRQSIQRFFGHHIQKCFQQLSNTFKEDSQDRGLPKVWIHPLLASHKTFTTRVCIPFSKFGFKLNGFVTLCPH